MHETPEGSAIVAQGAFDYVKELEAALLRGGLTARVVRPPKEHCGT